jgi:hypothetical protein
MARFGSGWSGGAQLFWTPSREGAELVLSPTLPAQDRYRLRLAYTRAPDYARVRVSIDGLGLGEVDGFGGRVETAAGDVGEPVDLTAGAHELVFTIAGRNPGASGLFAGLDRIEFVRVPAAATPPETPQTPVPSTPTAPPLPPWTSKDVIDERIDVAAQYALMRMFKGDPTERVDASNILSAVKSGALGGIYQEDQRVPALRAQSLGTWWGTILPKPAGGISVDGVCMLEPREKPPILVMRRKAEKNPAAYDRSLQAAWAMCGLPPSPVRPYQTTPGAAAPPGKAGRCAAPTDAPMLSVVVMRGGKVVSGAEVSASRSPDYAATQITSNDGTAVFEPGEGGLYLVRVAGGTVAPEEASSRSVEVLPKCFTLAAFELAEAGGDPCEVARARASSECLTPEVVDANATCNSAYAGAIGSCPDEDTECQDEANRLYRDCMAPVDEQVGSCRKRIDAEAGCPAS